MSQPIIQLTTEELAQHLAEQDATLIDVRPADAYNGWPLKQEQRGGHIAGARNLPLKWAGYIDWLEIVRSKGIKEEDTLVLYGYSADDAEQVARRFIRSGYHAVKVYNDFKDEWSADPLYPMGALKHYRNLVPAVWLKKLQDNVSPGEYEQNKYVVCHAHYRHREAYEEGHIPGAIALDTNTLESPETWNRRSAEELKAALEGMGITHDTTVILYGRFAYPDNNDPFPGSSAGQLAAIRSAVIMMYAGVKDVRVLNGGLQSWVDEGCALSFEDAEYQPIDDFGCEIPARPKIMIDTLEAREYLQSVERELISVRSWPEFCGETSGYNYIEKKGRIPGAVFGNCGSDAYHMENYRNPDHTMREYHEIEQFWREAGITPEKANAFYCGTGWRGSEAFFCAWLMGWPRVSVYDGGWFEWSNDPENPVERGVPSEDETGRLADVLQGEGT
ncbi:MAG: rhodanese-like domain-containing protein [Candidatus Omnitrophota bacterium]